MVTSSLEEREVQLLLVALRYWRAHRSEGATRHSDLQLTPDIVDRLLAKLAAACPVENDLNRRSPSSNDLSSIARPKSARDDVPSRPTRRP